MNEKWEIRRVSTSERIFDKIKTEVSLPVGIMLFGADCEFKNKIINELICKFDLVDQGCIDPWDLDYEHSDCFLKTRDHLLYRFEAGKLFNLVILDSDSSADHEIRHGFVKAMQDAGAKTLVGIYTKVNKEPIRPLMSSLEKVELNKQITAIEQSNPSADGLDYLIVVEEEKE